MERLRRLPEMWTARRLMGGSVAQGGGKTNGGGEMPASGRAVLVMITLLLAGAASAQSLKDRQQRFYTASCAAVWQHAVSAFGEKGFDPEQMDRDSGFMKFEYSRGGHHAQRQGLLAGVDVFPRALGSTKPFG